MIADRSKATMSQKLRLAPEAAAAPHQEEKEEEEEDALLILEEDEAGGLGQEEEGKAYSTTDMQAEMQAYMEATNSAANSASRSQAWSSVGRRPDPAEMMAVPVCVYVGRGGGACMHTCIRA